MSILDRTSLEQSSLADLHAIASELSIDSFRRLRKAELIDAILDRQGAAEAPPAAEAPESESADDDEELLDTEELASAVEEELRTREDEGRSAPPRRGRRGGRGRGRAADAAAASGPGDDAPRETGTRVESEEPSEASGNGRQEDAVEGVIEVLPGGSGFVRVSPPDPSDDDVYVSAAQVRRCELVSGDRVAGPRRGPRRSERFASLVRVDTVNGEPVSDRTDGVRFDDLPVAYPSELLPIEAEDPNITAVLSIAPFGRGSRAMIVGPPHSGKTELLRRLAAGLTGDHGLEMRVVLSGVRPEEIAEWESGSTENPGALGLDASPETRGNAIETVIEQARRLVTRGSHVVVLIDTLDGLPEETARKTMAAARRIADGGSLTVIATASRPLGGETTLISLSPLLAAAGRFPAIDAVGSWTARAEALVGEQGAQEIAQHRAQALDG